MRIFRIKPSTVHDTFGNETIIVNLDTGAYYSAQGTASVVWGLIGEGFSEQDILQCFDAGPETGPASRSKDMAEFFEQLLAEALVEADAASSGKKQARSIAATSEEFLPPVLQKYTDMEEMLLLDPVHEVDEQGWPTTRKQRD